MKKISLTTVTPVFSGKDFLPALIAKIEELRDKWAESKSPIQLSEAIFVSDASTDGSLDILYDLRDRKDWIRVISLSRNFGQHQATVAGILHSAGDWVVTLDEDLQHDPFLIDKMLELAVTSVQDIVYAAAREAVHENKFRDWSSKLFKKTVSFITGNRHVEKFGSFRLIRGPIARASSSICSHGAYFDVTLCWFTDRIVSLHLPLKDIRYIESRSSGYTFRKLLSHAKRMIVSSEVKVIRVGASIGLFTIFVSLILGFKILVTKLIDPVSIPVQGWTSLFLVSLFFGGLLAFMTGIALEYISVILLHIQGKPTFFTIDRLTDAPLLAYYNAREGR